MKNLKKLLTALLILGGGLVLFGCSDTEEDDELVVAFTVSGSDTDTSRTVTMKAPDEYKDKNIQIVYTLDGSTPDITYDKTAYQNKTSDSVAEYVNYGTASLYDSEVTVAVTTTIKARAFYVDTASEKCVMGSEWTPKEVKVTVAKNNTNVTDSAGASSGTFKFSLASTGNSNTYHYFDTSSSNVFKLNSEHQKVYYQTSFSYKGKGKGNWYLYMRDLNGGLVKKDSANFLAQGTYKGDCFDKASKDVEAGDLTLYNGTDTTEGKAASIVKDGTNPAYFDLKVLNSVSDNVIDTTTTTDALGNFTVDAK